MTPIPHEPEADDLARIDDLIVRIRSFLDQLASEPAPDDDDDEPGANDPEAP